MAPTWITAAYCYYIINIYGLSPCAAAGAVSAGDPPTPVPDPARPAPATTSGGAAAATAGAWHLRGHHNR